MTTLDAFVQDIGADFEQLAIGHNVVPATAIGLPPGLAAEQLARKVNEHRDVRILRNEELPVICSDVLARLTTNRLLEGGISD